MEIWKICRIKSYVDGIDFFGSARCSSLGKSEVLKVRNEY